MSGWERGNSVIKGVIDAPSKGTVCVARRRQATHGHGRGPLGWITVPWGGDQLETLRVGRRLGRAGWRKESQPESKPERATQREREDMLAYHRLAMVDRRDSMVDKRERWLRVRVRNGQPVRPRDRAGPDRWVRPVEIGYLSTRRIRYHRCSSLARLVHDW